VLHGRKERHGTLWRSYAHEPQQDALGELVGRRTASPPHRQGEGDRRPGTRRRLLSGQVEERLQSCWMQVIEKSGRQNEPLQDWLLTGGELRDEVGQLIPSAFRDPDFVVRAFQLHRTHGFAPFFRVDLREGWQRHVFDLAEPLRNRNEVPSPGKNRGTEYYVTGNQLMSEILGIKWPFFGGVDESAAEK
jgi:hypothetical protein